MRRVFNIGGYETFAVEAAWPLGDEPNGYEKAGFYLMRQVIHMALPHILNVYHTRSGVPHPNVEMRDQALSGVTHAYQQALKELEALDTQIAALEGGQCVIVNGVLTQV